MLLLLKIDKVVVKINFKFMPTTITFSPQEFEGLFQLQHEGKQIPQIKLIMTISSRDLTQDNKLSNETIVAYEVEFLNITKDPSTLCQEAKEAGARLERMRMTQVYQEGTQKAGKESI